MKKRTLSLLLCLVLCCALLPAGAMAVPRRSIAAVSLSITAPVHGEKPTYSASRTGTEDRYRVMDVTSGSFTHGIYWYDETANRQLKTDSVFVGGHTYSVHIGLEKTGSTDFSDSVTGTINGTEAAVEHYNEGILVSASFQCPELPITTASVTIDAPEAGKTPSFTAQPEGSLYTADSVTWYRVSPNQLTKIEKTLSASDSFEAGKTYVVDIKLVPVSGYTFLSTVDESNVRINGVDPTFVQNQLSQGIHVQHAFALPMADTPITSLDLYIDEPAYDATPDFSALSTDDGIDTSSLSIIWSDNAAGMTLEEDDHFDGGRSYTVTLSGLKPLTGYVFQNPTVRINGNPAETEGNEQKLIVSRTFAPLPVPKLLQSIAITTPPDKTDYWDGEIFDPAGMVVTATYSDGTEAAVTGFETPDAVLSEDVTTVTVSYTENGITRTADQKVRVQMEEPEAPETPPDIILQSIAVTTPPDKTVYQEGESFDPAGMVVTATYSDGTKTAVTGYTVSPAGALSEGHKSVTVSYTENYIVQNATQPITVSSKPQPETKKNPFVDVKQSDYFYDAVLWAYYADPQVTNGFSATEFYPGMSVTRGQAVTFLWRAMGCPEPKSKLNPFTDVKENVYYYKPILWAVEKGITNGTGNGQFSPNQTCSTAHIITFLYRTLGIGANGWYQEAAAWAKGAGLLKGLTVKVEPGVECPRSDVVLFLYRCPEKS